MNYQEQTEIVEIAGYTWTKITQDQAFRDIVEGFMEMKERYYEPVKKFDVVVQAGGYCGVFARILSDKFGAVYTFEPEPMNFYCLVQNCQVDNVIKAQAALGKEHGLITVCCQLPNNRGMNYVRFQENSAIPSYRIDDLALKDCDLIVLDTEGFEYNILQGAEKTIDKFRPVISVEDTNSHIENFLRNFDYEVCNTAYRDTIYKCKH